MDPAAHGHSILDPRAAARPRRSPGAPVHAISRWTLCGLLGIAAGAKLLSPYQESYVLPESLYYSGAVVELAVAVLLHTRYGHFALAIAIAFALTGLTLAAVVPGRLCGCFGSLLPLDGKGHVLLAGAMGALACVGFRTGGGQQATAGANGAPG